MQLRTQFTDLNFEDALPAVKDIIQNKYKQYPQLGEMLYNVDSSDRSIEQSTGISGLGRFVETPEGTQHASDLFYQRFDKTYTHLKYTLSYALTRELVDDDQFNIVTKFSECLGRSAYDTRETHAASLFNDAFNGSFFVGGDASALCVNTHPLVAGTDGNLLSTAADLSVTSLQQATIELENTLDDRGLLANIHAKWLLHPRELKFVANELLKSMLLPNTANNNDNSLKMLNLEPLCWQYLTDSDAWFLVGDKGEHDLHWYNRDSFETYDYEKPEVEGRVIVGRMRYSFGFNDWRGVFGTPGA